MDFLRHLTPLLLMTASAIGVEQEHRLNVVTAWPGGFQFDVCIDHDINIKCGWEMELIFSKPLTAIDYWSTGLKSKENFEDGQRYLLRNLQWNKDQPSGSCHTFIARYAGNRPRVTASYTRTCNKGVWTDHSVTEDECSDTNSPSEPIIMPTELDYETEIRTQWSDNNGQHLYGEICFFHTAPISCGYDAEIVISPPIKALQIWSASVVDEVRASTEVMYKITNLQWTRSQEQNPTCHAFQATYRGTTRHNIIAGRYTRACHNGIDNMEPNKGATPAP